MFEMLEFMIVCKLETLFHAENSIQNIVRLTDSPFILEKADKNLPNIII